MERFILTEKEQQVFKLCSCLLNKDSSGMSFEEIMMLSLNLRVTIV